MNPADTTILWDFDNTLFQTRRFWKEKLFTAFTELGISSQEVERGFKLATTANPQRCTYFLPDLVVSCIAEVSGKDPSLLTPILEGIVYTNLGTTYFFEGALECVRSVHERGYRRYLLSYGDESFKRRWFASIELGSFFTPEEILITNQKKSGMLENLSLTPFVVTVNDVLEETLAFKEVLEAKGHTVISYHFVENPDTLPPQTDSVTLFTHFNELAKAL